MNNALTPEILAALSAVSLQCVECSALYPGLEVGSAFRYRCNCGGTLDVEMKFALREAQTAPVQAPPGISSGLKSDSDPALLTGTLLRQLFDERASTLPTWSLSAGKMLLDDMAAMGPVRLRDVDESQALLVNLAKDLAAKGEIMISKSRGDEELVY